MDFSVLGPLRVRAGQETVPVRRGLPRVLLTYLLLHPGEPVAGPVLADRLWNGQPPSDSANAVQRVVSYLRRTLGAAETLPLRTAAGAYALDVPPAAVDALRFISLVRAASPSRRPDPAGSLVMLEEALGLWRGEPLADVAELPWAAPHVAELEESYLQAEEERLTCLLDLGRHLDAVPQAQALVATHPLREGLRTSLMLALYRSGRQSDALAVAAALRRTLADELGLDPSPSVLELERRILQHDESLRAPATVHDSVRAASPGRPPAPVDAFGARPPRAVTSLVGREAEVPALSAALDEAELVTLTGPGGTGKTRLALAVLESRREPVVWFADLSGAATDESVPGVVAAATGAPTSPDTDVADAVVAHLAGKSGVVVLDTCEHVVIGAGRLAAALLQGCPGIRQVATSRRPLRVAGEVTWPVPPLGLPPAHPGVPPSEVRSAPSVELFAQRARAVQPGFRIDDSNAEDVAAICRALDGLPLAIELAAAHADVLSADGIRRRLDDRFALLVSDTHDVSERQRTLHAAISSSVDLLTAEERDLFGSLSVFAGTFDLEAALAVASPAGPAEQDQFRALASLLRQSLLTRAGTDRYRMLDSLRAYAADLLGRSPGGDLVRQRHAEYHAALAEDADLQVRTDLQEPWLARLRETQPEFRAALAWCLEGHSPELGARLVGALAWFWTLEGLLAEASHWLERAEAVPLADPRARARVLLGVGLVSAPLGRLHRARDACAEAADLCRSVGDDRGTGDALITLGAVLWALDDLDGAAAAHDEAIRRLARSDSWRQDVAAVLRSRTSVDRGEPDATDRVAAALQAARRTRDAHLVGLALLQQCRDALRKGRRDEAVGAARGALQASRRIRYREGEAAALTLLARGHLLAPAEEDEVAAAREAAEEAISLAVSIDHRGALCHAVETLGAVRAAAGDDAEALLLLEVAAADRERRQMPNARVERALTLDLTGELRERLGASAADVAREAAGTPIDTLIRERRLGTARPAP